MTTFMHFRKYDRYGQIMPKGGMTLAIDQDGNKLRVAMAECGRKDNFNRVMGRTIAAGRLNSTKVVELALPPETVPKSFVINQPFVRDRVQKLLAGGK